MKLQGMQWKAMNTRFTIFAPWTERALETGHPDWEFAMIQLVDQFEKTASRFYAFSETKRFELVKTGDTFRTSRLFGSILQDSLRMHQQTDGWFNPFLGQQMQDIGYDRSFEQLNRPSIQENRPLTYPPDLMDPKRPIVHSLAEDRTLWLKHQNVKLDFGGIGKGWIVDRIARQLRQVWHIPIGLVDAGGDLTVWSDSNAHPFPIEIQDPWDESVSIVETVLREGALATSNRIHRRWQTDDGKQHHHIMNPFTGLPAQQSTVQATVQADCAMHADVWAKCLLMMPPDRALQWLESQNGAQRAWLVQEDGQCLKWKKEGFHHG